MTEDRASVFVVVLRVRSTDDVVSVHRTREGADRVIDKFKSDLGRWVEYEWAERDYGRERGWVRYVDADGGLGPSARVELKPLRA